MTGKITYAFLIRGEWEYVMLDSDDEARRLAAYTIATTWLTPQRAVNMTTRQTVWPSWIRRFLENEIPLAPFCMVLVALAMIDPVAFVAVVYATTSFVWRQYFNA